jgi:Ca2+/Na+ antiporter
MIDISTTAFPLFAFYLLVFCNFTQEIIGCRLRTLLTENMLAKHALGFLLLFSLVILNNPENADKEWWINLAFTAFIYIWFMITARTPLYILIVTLSTLIVVFILNSTKNRKKQDGDEEGMKRIEKIQNIMAWAAITISIIGFVIYLIEKRKEYSKSFNIWRFIIGSQKCKNFTPKGAKIIQMV